MKLFVNRHANIETHTKSTSIFLVDANSDHLGPNLKPYTWLHRVPSLMFKLTFDIWL